MLRVMRVYMEGLSFRSCKGMKFGGMKVVKQHNFVVWSPGDWEKMKWLEDLTKEGRCYEYKRKASCTMVRKRA